MVQVNNATRRSFECTDMDFGYKYVLKVPSLLFIIGVLSPDIHSMHLAGRHCFNQLRTTNVSIVRGAGDTVSMVPRHMERRKRIHPFFMSRTFEKEL